MILFLYRKYIDNLKSIGNNAAMRNLPILSRALAIAALLLQPAGASTIEGVEFPDRRNWQGTELQLHSTGLLRYRLVFKAYVAALYLEDGVGAHEILDDVPRRIEIEYFWPIAASDFARATLDGIARNVDAATLDRFRKPIARLNALYEDVEPGDRYAMTYVPGLGTELALNGDPRGIIEGAEFSSALFSIWLGENPIDASLRKQLLGVE